MKKLISWAVIFQLIIPTAFAQTLNDSFEGTKPLTDSEQHQANTYYHQGMANDYLKEACSNKGKLKDGGFKELGCDDTSAEAGRVFKGTAGMLIEEALPKLYAIMGTVAAASGGGKIQMKPKADKNLDAGADKTNDAQKGEERVMSVSIFQWQVKLFLPQCKCSVKKIFKPTWSKKQLIVKKQECMQ
jgi:hypothetical protein